MCVKSTCDVENVQRRPMGGIDGCILLLNELLVLRNVDGEIQTWRPILFLVSLHIAMYG